MLTVGMRLTILSCHCNVWFSTTRKKRISERAKKRAEIASLEDDVGVFKNVRLSYGKPPDYHKPFGYDASHPSEFSRARKKNPSSIEIPYRPTY